MSSLSHVPQRQPMSVVKSNETKSATDQILAILNTRNFSDTSMLSLVDALIKHGLGNPGDSKAISALCNDLKTSIRWHATASQAAAFQMALGARLSEEFYRDWKATSANIDRWAAFHAELYIHGVVPLHNVWHVAFHVAQSFDSPTQLTAIFAALEQCKAHQSSNPFFSSPSRLVDKVEARLEVLSPLVGMTLSEHAGIVERIRSLGIIQSGFEEGSRTVRDRESDAKHADIAKVLERVVVDVALAMDVSEKEKVGKSKAKE